MQLGYIVDTEAPFLANVETFRACARVLLPYENTYDRDSLPDTTIGDAKWLDMCNCALYGMKES